MNILAPSSHLPTSIGVRFKVSRSNNRKSCEKASLISE